MSSRDVAQQIAQQILDLAGFLERLPLSTDAVFDAAPSNAWETPMQQYSTLSTRERMMELYRQSVKAPEIAGRFGKSPMSLYRLIERQQDREAVGDH